MASGNGEYGSADGAGRITFEIWGDE